MNDEIAKRWKSTLQERYPGREVDGWVSNLSKIYERFKAAKLEDPHFDIEFAAGGSRHAQRLGEMLLFDRLEYAGFQLSSDKEGPDFRAEKDGVAVWFELITPTVGDDGRLAAAEAAYDPLRPDPQLAVASRELKLLRVTHALRDKAARFDCYRESGLIADDEPCIVVINDALLAADFTMFGIGHDAGGGISGASLLEHATLGLASSHWELDESGKRHVLVPSSRQTAQKACGVEVPVAVFDDGAESAPMRHVSAALQVTLREAYGFAVELREHANAARMPLHWGTFVRNSNAQNPLPAKWEQGLLALRPDAERNG